ncbi:MAG TPA: hypothetical protein VIN59_05340 [Alphaproteobacteria bacterium]
MNKHFNEADYLRGRFATLCETLETQLNASSGIPNAFKIEVGSGNNPNRCVISHYHEGAKIVTNLAGDLVFERDEQGVMHAALEFWSDRKDPEPYQILSLTNPQKGDVKALMDYLLGEQKNFHGVPIVDVFQAKSVDAWTALGEKDANKKRIDPRRPLPGGKPAL